MSENKIPIYGELGCNSESGRLASTDIIWDGSQNQTEVNDELRTTKADDFLLEGGTLYLTSGGEIVSRPVILPGVGGIELNIRNLIGASFSVAYKSDAYVMFSPLSIDTLYGSQTGKITRADESRQGEW